ncbi:Protein AF-9 [Liparis tanakae]|uniref:Protein AF-9 n=1 Tax=Liparis tanakae TaxID=230148 RepID=A0A4Z2FM22_9TELE|nr:Protein AF-9 [Liparis tanakae]
MHPGVLLLSNRRFTTSAMLLGLKHFLSGGSAHEDEGVGGSLHPVTSWVDPPALKTQVLVYPPVVEALELGANETLCKDPPYKLEESGYAGFILPIEVYFKNKEEPKKVRFDYDLFLHLEGHPPVNHLRCEKLTFNNPTEEFRRKLLKAGGVGVRNCNDVHN